MYHYIIIILFLLFTTSCNDNSTDSSSSKMEEFDELKQQHALLQQQREEFEQQQEEFEKQQKNLEQQREEFEQQQKNLEQQREEFEQQQKKLEQQRALLEQQRKDFERAKLAQQDVKPPKPTEPVISSPPVDGDQVNVKPSKPAKPVIPPPPVDGDQVNFAAIFNPPPVEELKQDMFESDFDFKKRVENYPAHRMQLFEESLAKFNKSVIDGDKRYQAGVVSLTNYDPDNEILSFEIKWQAKWVKQFFTDFPYEKQKEIKISPDEAKALWEAGKEKPFFINIMRLDDRAIINYAIVQGKKNLWNVRVKTGFSDRLKDGGFGPEMVWIPAGDFRMGDIQGGGNNNEQPVHRVSVGRFAMGKYEVTVAEYNKFAKATDRKKKGNRLTNYPVGVTWHEATAYAEWLSEQTGEYYRLPTEAEWEYAARAGTETKFWWGNEINRDTPKCHGCGVVSNGSGGIPVGSYIANPFGLYDTVGNVSEWTCSEYEAQYNGLEEECVTSSSHLSVRGGSSNDNNGKHLRLAKRIWLMPSFEYGIGFRVIRE